MLASRTQLTAVLFVGGLTLASCGGAGGTSSVTPLAQPMQTAGGHNESSPAGSMPIVVATGLENPRGIRLRPRRPALRCGRRIGRLPIDCGPLPPSSSSGWTVSWRVHGAHFGGRRNDGRACDVCPASSVESDCVWLRRFRERRRGRHVLEWHAVCAYSGSRVFARLGRDVQQH